MFALFINDVENNLPGSVCYGDLFVKLLLYADDLVVFSDNPVTLQLQINKLKQYCDTWDLKINTQKSKVMIFSSRNRATNNERNWTLDGVNIEVVSEFKYLGFTISHNLNINAHIKEKLRVAKSAINSMWSQFFSSKFVDPKSKFKVFNATVNSCLCYGNEVFGYQLLEEMEVIQRYFFKRIFRLPPNTPNYAIHVESGLPQISLRNLKANADYLIKVMHRSDSNLQKKILLISLHCGYNPFRSWSTLASENNMTMNLNANNIEEWKNIFYDCISTVDEQMFKVNLERARESASRPTYSLLNHILNENNYFRDDLTAFDMSLIFKVRTENLELNYRPHRTDINPICSLCNLNQNENVYHFLAVCPILQEIRRLYFNESFLSSAECFRILNGERDWKLLVRYVSHALNYRNSFLNMF